MSVGFAGHFNSTDCGVYGLNPLPLGLISPGPLQFLEKSLNRNEARPIPREKQNMTI